jgi:phosphoglycolate phosphatase
VARLIVLDCDGTLVDSQHVIVDAMSATFVGQGLAPPSAEAIRHVVGLSLAEAIARLVPGIRQDACALLVDGYKQSFQALRLEAAFHEPLFEGVSETLRALAGQGHLLAVATGKSDRGLASVLATHGLADLFASLQTADRHPSKPHPGMIEAAMRETGATADETIMVGDTSYDIEMARAARVHAVGVSWGYHPVAMLEAAGADAVIDRFEQLLALTAAR